MWLLSLALALLPAWVLLRYFVNSDRFPEPEDKIKKTFRWGVFTVVPVLLVAYPLSVMEGQVQNIYLRAAYKAFATAAIPEEFCKYCVLLWYCSRLRAFDEPMDGIVYGATASLGFAALENVMYSTGDIGTGLLRACTAVPAHASWGAIMGYHFARAHFNGRTPGFLHIALFIPIVLHGLYNFFLFVMAELSDGLGPTEEAATGDAVLILGCLMLAIATLGYSIYSAYSFVREMRKAQDAMPL